MRDTVLVDESARQVASLPEFVRLEFVQHRNEFSPVRSQRPIRLHHFIRERRIDSVFVCEAATKGMIRIDAAR